MSKSRVESRRLFNHLYPYGHWFSRTKRKTSVTTFFYIAGLFVFVAFGFALIIQSGAILFDGVYSLIAFFMALLTLKVANLVQLPDDDRFHFGYYRH